MNKKEILEEFYLGKSFSEIRERFNVSNDEIIMCVNEEIDHEVEKIKERLKL